MYYVIFSWLMHRPFIFQLFRQFVVNIYVSGGKSCSIWSNCLVKQEICYKRFACLFLQNSVGLERFQNVSLLEFSSREEKIRMVCYG